ncbi:hypothetical protein BC936DRAFT_145612 [Jimgerdemannia flammicorona]|uniref:Uncharacterized protein n=2 Tax=Jimgerdemannia flammicorona TaxID=994334 RepID=A0A433DNG9_9FUNG|nr:hypothetical protein BC936DRAFT_145612 [Jimgerdemannia flammicorona]RUS35216.1 hypothetical protein BC938DRAFT_474067 [Jimgerdemannia flammicorona]
MYRNGHRKVRRNPQHLLLLDLHNRFREMRGTSIRQIVPIHACQHHVIQPPPSDGLSGVLWLVHVERLGVAVCLNGAEAAAAGALVAHEHDCCCSGLMLTTAPAVADVGASRLLADGMQAQPAKVLLDTREVLTHGNISLEPGREARLLAMFGCVVERVVCQSGRSVAVRRTPFANKLWRR